MIPVNYQPNEKTQTPKPHENPFSIPGIRQTITERNKIMANL